MGQYAIVCVSSQCVDGRSCGAVGVAAPRHRHARVPPIDRVVAALAVGRRRDAEDLLRFARRHRLSVFGDALWWRQTPTHWSLVFQSESYQMERLSWLRSSVAGLLLRTPHVASTSCTPSSVRGPARCVRAWTRRDWTRPTPWRQNHRHGRPTRAAGHLRGRLPRQSRRARDADARALRTRVQDARSTTSAHPVQALGRDVCGVVGRDRLHEVVHAQVGVAPDKWVTSTVVYLDASVVAGGGGVLGRGLLGGES